MPDHPTTQNQDGLEARDSGSLLRVIADAIPASMAYFEAETLRCRFANERYARATGHRVARLVNLSEGGGYAPSPMPVPMMANMRMSKDMAGAAPVSAGELTVRVDISGLYELTR